MLPTPPGLSVPDSEIAGKSGEQKCTCYCKCVDPTTTTFTGIYGYDSYPSLALAFEEDVEPAPSSVFGIVPIAEVAQVVGAGPALGLEQPGAAILPALVQQIAPSFELTVMPGNVFAGPVVPFGGDLDAIGGLGGREDSPGGIGGIAGVGIGPLPWMTVEEEVFSRPPPRPPIEVGVASSVFPTATTVSRVFDNITGTAEYARQIKPPVAPDYILLGYPRERRVATKGLEVAPHAGYFYFGGMDFGPNAGIGSDGTLRLHDGYHDQVRRLPPAREPDGMCGHAMSTGAFAKPRRDFLRDFKGEKRGLALGAGPAIAPDSVSDAPDGVPAVVEAEAPLSPMREDVVAERDEVPERFSKGSTTVLRDLLEQMESERAGGGTFRRGTDGGGLTATDGAVVDDGAGSAMGQSFGGGKPGAQTAGLAAAGSMAGVGGGGGGLVGQSAAARVERERAFEENTNAQQKLADAQKKEAETSKKLMAAQAEHRAAENKEAIEKAQSEVAAARAEKDAAYHTADGERQREARERLDAAEKKLKEEQQKVDPNSAMQKEAVDKATEENAKAEKELSKAEKEAAKAQARYERTKEAVEALDDKAAHTEPSYGNYLKRVGEAVERYRKYKADAERRQNEHDAKMGAGAGSGSANKEKRDAAVKAAREARELRQSARNGRDAATNARARLTQLRGHISPETAKNVKDKAKAAKEAAKDADKAGKKAQDAARYGPPSRVAETEAEKMKAQMDLKQALDDLATALKEAEDEAKKNKMEEEGEGNGDGDGTDDEGGDTDGGDDEDEEEEEEEEEDMGPCADYNPDECMCPGDCEEDGKECLWCMWVPWPPPGVKGKGAAYAPPQMGGLMPPDTGMMSVMGFPFYAMMQEQPAPAPPKKDEKEKGKERDAKEPGQPSSGTGGTTKAAKDPCADFEKAVEEQRKAAKKALIKSVVMKSGQEGSGPFESKPVDEEGKKIQEFAQALVFGAFAKDLTNAYANMAHYLKFPYDAFPVLSVLNTAMGKDRDINVDAMIKNNKTMGDATGALVKASVDEIETKVASSGDGFIYVSAPRTVTFLASGSGPFSDLDLRFAFGTLSFVLVACVTKCGDGWIIKYKIIAYDRYNWDPGKSTSIPGLKDVVKDADLGLLHEQGLAMEYDLIGESATVEVVLCPKKKGNGKSEGGASGTSGGK